MSESGNEWVGGRGGVRERASARPGRQLSRGRSDNFLSTRDEVSKNNLHIIPQVVRCEGSGLDSDVWIRSARSQHQHQHQQSVSHWSVSRRATSASPISRRAAQLIAHQCRSFVQTEIKSSILEITYFWIDSTTFTQIY